MMQAQPNTSTFTTVVLSFASGLLTGLPAGFLLEQYRERKRAKTARSSEIYRPLHEELTVQIERIVDHVRPGASITWQRIKAGGLAKLICKKLRDQIELFYARTLPEYEAAWELCEDRINHVREEWDHRYGTPPGGTLQRDIDWFSFLVSPECVPPPVIVNEGEALRIRNYSILSYWFRDHGTNPQRFLRERWNEAVQDEAIVTYRHKYEKAVQGSKELLKNIEKGIAV
jgi:hypothetical protein